MRTPSAEALLISALLNNSDVNEASKHNITSDKMRTHHDEYVWLQTYLDNYGEQPSTEAFLHAFPDFPLREHYDVRYAADQVLKSFFSTRLTHDIAEAVESLKAGDVAQAYATVRQNSYQLSSAVPTNLVQDMNFLDDYNRPPAEVIKVPWSTLQGATGGLHKGNYAVLAARLGQGKTALLMALAAHALWQGQRVLFYSLEMTEHEVRNRLHAILARDLGYTMFTLNALRRREVDLRDYKELIQEFTAQVPGQIDVHTPADGPVSPATIASRAKDYDLVIVDYETLMVTDAGQAVSEDWRTATQVSNGLKRVALAENVALCVAAQINREGDTNGWRPPKVKNLAQADSIGQDADLVVTFKAYTPESLVLSIEKNRHGASGQLFFTQFRPNEGIFAEITRDVADDLKVMEED